MDSVRFGRALGIGARLAAKTAVAAVDAALAPNPNTPPSSPIASAGSSAQRMAEPNPISRPTHATAPAPSAPQQARHLVKALSSPVRRLSGVLWLELTGVFFGLFALSGAVGALRLRSAWRATPAGSSDHTHFLLALGIALLFAYFCASSFMRARRRNRQP